MPKGTMNEASPVVPATRRATISPRVAVVPSPLVKAAGETSSGEHADWDMLKLHRPLSTKEPSGRRRCILGLCTAPGSSAARGSTPLRFPVRPIRGSGAVSQ